MSGAKPALQYEYRLALFSVVQFLQSSHLKQYPSVNIDYRPRRNEGGRVSAANEADFFAEAFLSK